MGYCFFFFITFFEKYVDKPAEGASMTTFSKKNNG